ncbi:hypothetical protein EHS25_002587 [Saitozyma podzolica]|uniref:Uncharacterized protein n=1 Tax=Saitozyma podzolica TaxID=1890683 RepID=A0A427YCQ8_9TREE|nr:hypothetical protein EHS25_002587 [Saitozyma podzolica]
MGVEPSDAKLKRYFARLQLEASRLAEEVNMSTFYTMDLLPEQAWERLKDTDTGLPPATYIESDSTFVISTPSDRGDAITQTTYKIEPPLLTGWSATAAAGARNLIFGMTLGTVDLDE